MLRTWSRIRHGIVPTCQQFSEIVSRRLTRAIVILYLVFPDAAVSRTRRPNSFDLMTAFRWFIIIAAVCAVAPAAATAQHATTVVIIVRHAEKDTVPLDDPPLTAAGAARALALDRALARATVQAVITTQLRRTRETARPLVERLGLVIQTVTRGANIAAHARAVAAAVRKAEGKTVLVVGHGETVGPIIAALGGPKIKDLCVHEYSHLFVLILEAGSTRFVRAEYGAPSPAPRDACVPEVTP